MSENEKDDKGYEFIKEQIVEKKRKKYKKWVASFCMTVIMAIIFGVIAAVTFCLVASRLSQHHNLSEEVKTPVSFPEEEESNVEKAPEKKEDNHPLYDDPPSENINGSKVDTLLGNPDTVIIERVIEADIEDLININAEMRRLAYDTNKSIVKLNCKFVNTDIFNNPIERNITTTGVVVANNNVELLILVSLDRVKDANSVHLELTENTWVNAVIYDFDKEVNMAILAVNIAEIPVNFQDSIKVVTVGESYTLVVGSPIIALGNPNGYPRSMDIGYITSKGSSFSITDNKLDLFNTSIRDNSNSDGIIINLKGEVIGVMTRTLKDGFNRDVNTVIGISKLKPILERMMNQTPRIYFGVKTGDMTEQTKINYNIRNGIYVNEVIVNSPAFHAGIKAGDIIQMINQLDVKNTNDFHKIISSYSSGEDITVKIKRTSPSVEKEVELKLRLTERER